MITLELPYVHEDVDRHGNVRIYFHRRGQRKIRLRSPVGTQAFTDEYYSAKLASDAGGAALGPRAAAGSPRPVRGTYRWLCVQFLASPDFASLDKQTQRTRRRILELTWDEPTSAGATTIFADFPLNRLTPKAIAVLRDRKRGLIEAANMRVRAIRRVFTWAMANELVSTNPAKDVCYLANPSTGYHTWSVGEVAAFRARHALGTKAHLALSLLLYLGVRRSDVVRLGRQHVRDGTIRFTAHKNRNRNPVSLQLPMLPVLHDVIEKSPTGDLTFLLTEHGCSFTAAGFGMWFRRRCDEAGLGNCSAHGLRKAGATIAAENGATPHQLMAIFGWRTLREAERYAQAARQHKIAAGAMTLLLSDETSA